MASSIVDEIKERLDIVDVLGEYINLQKAGHNYKALCPFHNEKTPSFVVFPDTQTWHCFGACQTGGDIFTFVMKKENLDFREALQLLARKAGVSLHATESKPDADRLDRLRKLNAAAAAYFRETLQRHPEAEAARQYAVKRHLDRDICDLFQIGYALESWDALEKAMISLSFSREELVEAGLSRIRDDGSGQYDRFRGRLMFPISDKQGRIVGFGGRLLGPGQPKYLNTPQTPLFDKSSILYGLAQARRAIREQGHVVIVEGYMDVLAAHQFGYHNVIGSMGTALTDAQLRQLKREAENVILALDADIAGQQATLRGLEVARGALARETIPVLTTGGLIRFEERLQSNIFILHLPEGKDPDEFIRSHPDQWPAVVAQAVPIIDFYMRQAVAELDLATATGKAEAVKRIEPVIRELSDNIKRYHYVQKLSRLLQVDERYLMEQFAAKAPRRRSSHRSSHMPTVPTGKLEVIQLTREEYIVAQLIHYPTMMSDINTTLASLNQPSLREDDCENATNRALLQWVMQLTQGEEFTFTLDNMTPAVREQQIRLLNGTGGQPELPYDERLADIVDVILHMRLERTQEALRQINQLLKEDHSDSVDAKQYLTLYKRHASDSYNLQQALKRRTI